MFNWEESEYLHYDLLVTRTDSFSCAFTAKHGEEIGWNSRYSADHIIEAAGEEVELILKHM